jgi:hypothetical protein
LKCCLFILKCWCSGGGLIYTLQLVVGLFGMVGNTLSTITLSSKEMKNPFNRLLLALACFDNIFIFFVVLDYSFIRGMWIFP